MIQAIASLVRKLKSRPSISHLIVLRQKMQDALRRAHDTSVGPDEIH